MNGSMMNAVTESPALREKEIPTVNAAAAGRYQAVDDRSHTAMAGCS